MNYNETINFLYTLLPLFFNQGKSAIKKGLGNIVALCNYLGNPQQQFKSIHIAGTNGKGSTAHMLASIFQSQGYKTGLYTSPHLIDFRERIKINGKMASKNYVIHFVKRHRVFIESLQPSFFEITVAMAFDYFAKNNVAIAIIETGLGGRLDSTNIITPELSIITNISFDHKDVLGDTISAIAAEKAGIIKDHIPVVIGRKDPESDKVFMQVATARNSDIYFAEDVYDPINFSINNPYKYFVYLNDYKQYIENKFYSEYQFENIKTVLSAIKVWNKNHPDISLQFTSIKEGIEQVQNHTGLRGRWQVLQNQPTIIADVAHNEDGLRKVFCEIEKSTYTKIWIIYGTLKDKDIRSIIPILPSHAHYLLTHPDTPRRMDVDLLSTYFDEANLYGQTFSSPSLALQYATAHASPNDIILVTGSFYVVNEIIEEFTL